MSAPLAMATNPAPALAGLRELALEDERIWTRDWVCVGVEQQIPDPGDLLPATVGHHGLHVQRAPKGDLRASFNVLQYGSCWTIPAQCGNGHKTKCPYISCAHSLDTDALRAALEGWVRRHETLRSGFRAHPGRGETDGVERFVLPAEKVELVARDAGECTGSDELRERLTRRLDETCRPLSWPSYLFTTILRPGGATVFCGFDHCHVDGYSLAIAVHEIRESYRAYAIGSAREPDRLPEAGSRTAPEPESHQ
jgi:hypothetical protein